MEIYHQISFYINIPYLGTFMFFSYLVKNFFKTLLDKSFNRDIKMVYVVLIIATIIAIPYIILMEMEWQKILLSYALGTSLHETLFFVIDEIKDTIITKLKKFIHDS